MPIDYRPTATDSDRDFDDFDLPLTFDATPRHTLEDVVGMDGAKSHVRSIVEPLVQDAPIKTHSLLVHGPSGNGKTCLVDAIAGELAAEGFSIGWLNSLDGVPANECDVLARAVREAVAAAPSVLVLDQLREFCRNDVVDCLRDELARIAVADERVLVVATATPETFVSSVPTPAPFETAIKVDEPDAERAKALLETYLAEYGEAGDVEVTVDVESDPIEEGADGLTAAELRLATKQAVQNATVDVDAECAVVTVDVLEDALRRVTDDRLEPSSPLGSSRSSTDSHLVEQTDVSFDDIGGLDDVERELRATLEYPERFPAVYEDCNLETPGVLLYGPPGNGKTMLAKAVANEYDRTFIAVEGPELQGRFVGQTEARIRKVFETAREHAPSVVFFDEIDALAPNRNEVHASFEVDFVNTLLAELDGFEDTSEVFVLAATNRPHALDPALLRPGRLERHVHVSAPDSEGACEVVDVHTTDFPLADDVTTEWIADVLPEGCSAATITGIVDHALRWHAMDRVDRNDGTADDLEVRREDVLAAVEDYPTDPDTDSTSDDRHGFY